MESQISQQSNIRIEPKVVLTKVSVNPALLAKLHLKHQSDSDPSHPVPTESANVSREKPHPPMLATSLPTLPNCGKETTDSQSSVSTIKVKVSGKRRAKFYLGEEKHADVSVKQKLISKPLNFGVEHQSSVCTSSVIPSTSHSLLNDPSSPFKSIPSPLGSPSKLVDAALVNQQVTMALTTSSVVSSPQPPLNTELNSIMDWFEDQAQTATKQLAEEPLENSCQENSTGNLISTPAVPQAKEDVAHTSPVLTTAGAPLAAKNNSMPVKHKPGRPGKSDGKRKPGRPRKEKHAVPRLNEGVANTSPASAVAEAPLAAKNNLMSEKRKRGRPRKSESKKKQEEQSLLDKLKELPVGRPVRKTSLREKPYPSTDEAGRKKKKSQKSSQPVIKNEPSDFSAVDRFDQSSLTSSATKKKKKYDKNGRESARIITQMFHQLTAGDTGTQGMSPMSQPTPDDPGYYTCVSGSDSGSRTTTSHSPVDVMLSPTIVDYPQTEICFTTPHSKVLIKDPVLHDSSSQPPLDQSEGIVVSVLDSGQCDEQTIMSNSIPSDAELLQQLGALIEDDTTPIFISDEMIVGDTQEVTTFEDEDDILNSETVTDCLKELKQHGRIGGTSQLVPTPSIPDGHTNVKRLVRARGGDEATKRNKTSPPKPKKVLSMINSRTKSGRVSRPTARMINYGSKAVEEGNEETYNDSPMALKMESEVINLETTKEQPTKEQAPPTDQGEAPPTTLTPYSDNETTQSPQIMIMKDLRLSLSRSPAMKKLTDFSFKLPELSPTNGSNDTPSEGGQELENYKRIVTIEPTPPPQEPEREVKFKDSNNPPENSKEAGASTSSNVLSMSLETILEEMDAVKAAEVSKDGRIVTVNPPDPPIFKRLDQQRMVRFINPENSCLPDRTLFSLPSPESSLDQLLQGESLFGGRLGPEEPTASRLDIKETAAGSKFGMENVAAGSRFGREEVAASSETVTQTEPEATAVLCIEKVSSPADKSVATRSPKKKFDFNLSIEEPTKKVEAELRDTSKPTPRPSAGDSTDEDMIDLHADDFDLFDSDLKETVHTPYLDNIFQKPLNPVKQPSAQPKATPTKSLSVSKRQNHLTPSNQAISPHNTRDSSPGFNHPPVLMPYKKEQVSQWVAEQQRRSSVSGPHNRMFDHDCIPYGHNGSIPADGQWSMNRNGNIRNNFVELQPHPVSPAAMAIDGHLGGGSLLEGHCRSYLRGRCLYNSCRFKHAPLSHVPLHVLEVALCQGSPLDKLPLEILHRYGNDYQSCVQLQASCKQFMDLLHGLISRNFSVVCTAYQYFAHTVRFSPALLTRIMELCSHQQPQGGIKPLTIVKSVYSDLQTRGRVSKDAYRLYMKTLFEFNKPEKAIEVYQTMRAQGEPPNYDIILLMIRLNEALEHRIFVLLEDLLLCIPPISDIEAARCANRLITIAEPSLLLKHASQLVQWVDRTPPAITSKLTTPCFLKLTSVLAQQRKWNLVFTLFSACSKHLSSLDNTLLCETLNLAMVSLGPSDKVIDTLGMLSEEQLVGISPGVWNQVILDCALKGRASQTTRFYQLAKKHLSSETLSAVMKLALSQGDYCEAMKVLKQLLQTTPTNLPPLDLLSQLCEVMTSPDDLQLVIHAVIITGATPPPAMVQSLLNAHSKQKSHKKLAEVVKLSLDYNIILDKLFYQKVLVELRSWGQDQDAISSIYKALRRSENLDTNCHPSTPSITMDTSCKPENPPPTLFGKVDMTNPSPLGSEAVGVANHPATVTLPAPNPFSAHIVEQMSKLPPPPPPPLPPSVGGVVRQALPTIKSVVKPNPLGVSMVKSSLPVPKPIQLPPPSTLGGVVKPLPIVRSETLSLDNVIQESARQEQDHTSLLELIEMNGSKGQFGAMASVLISLPGANVHYNNGTVGVVWRTINSTQKPANAFSDFVVSLAQFRVPCSQDNKLQTTFPQSDQWLITQVGIALIKTCEAHKDWQSAFVVLHYLQKFVGVHFVKLSQPSANLPPVGSIPLSPCSVVLMAVNVYIHMKQMREAMQLMQGCQWVQASTTNELLLRTELLMDMTEQLLDSGEDHNAWACLQTIDSGTIVKKFLQPVTNLHNKLLQTLLSSKEISLALSVYQTMRAKRLQCLSAYFSCLLGSLIDNNQQSIAEELCREAVADNCYPTMSRDNTLTLLGNLTRLELRLLLEHHITQLAKSVEHNKLQPLIVQFNTGCRPQLEQVFSLDFNPPMVVTFLSKANSLSISPSSMTTWANHHGISTKQEVSGAHITPMQAQSVTTIIPPSVKPPPTKTPSTAKRGLNETSTTSTSISHDSASKSHDSVSASHDHARVLPQLVESTPSTVTVEDRPVDSEAGEQLTRKLIRFRRKRTAPTPDSPQPGPPTKKPKIVAVEDKRQATKIVRKQLGRHYKSGKFKNDDDFRHLCDVLAHWYFKVLKSSGSSQNMSKDIEDAVAKLMSKISIYSPEMDNELGLTCLGSSLDV